MSQSDVIRGLGLPNTAAGQAVARALVETDELDNPLGFLSTEELGPNGSNLDRLIASAPRAEREQIYSRLVAGLASPVRVGSRSMTVSTSPGGTEILRARLAEARGETPRAAAPSAPNDGGWIGPTINFGVGQQTRAITDMAVAAVAGVGSMALGTAATAAVFLGAPVWVPITLGVAAVAAGLYATYRALKPLRIW